MSHNLGLILGERQSTWGGWRPDKFMSSRVEIPQPWLESGMYVGVTNLSFTQAHKAATKTRKYELAPSGADHTG